MRTPKRGLLRLWILLPERRKLVIVAVLSIVAFAIVQSILGGGEKDASISVRHVLSDGA
jgi:hypothetical protein